MTTDWKPPVCEHGKIVLACDEVDCEVQNEYLERQQETMRRWQEQLSRFDFLQNTVE